ncbi:molybdopterin synthase sulfur carrier subunit [Streptomyces tateyamensis]|uniref:Molybdopterin synthase sulfur carrier subunit n=1 Tax=Streptomyces tateyamensis TaxID=565073 RepID=A0A2V4NL07_9ACTN|nr:MoaD/ThiS family protein [Streptomyces tateyamensis]PYC85451.1 molybdopterin synthase sulfur carrier subunit [Streptomyces tateyamensis]
MTATTQDRAAVTGTIRYWAAAKAEAGLAEEAYRAATLAEALAQAKERHADRPAFVRLLDICSYLVDSEPVGGRDRAQVRLTEGGTVEVLPPFAGG